MVSLVLLEAPLPSPHLTSPLHLSGLYKDDLSQKATELWQTIVRLETEKYDLQERQKRQDYDVSNSQSNLSSINHPAERAKRASTSTK